jgi:hypothetical protein
LNRFVSVSLSHSLTHSHSSFLYRNASQRFASFAVQSNATFSFLIPLSSVEWGQEIGRGEFGVNYKGKYRGEAVLCNMIQPQVLGNAIEEFLQEAHLMSQIPKHRNVVRFIGVCRGENVSILSGKLHRLVTF